MIPTRIIWLAVVALFLSVGIVMLMKNQNFLLD